VKNPGMSDLEAGPGQILQRFTEDESLNLANHWIAVYAKNCRGLNLRAFLWHTFSAGAYPCVCEGEAERLYAQQIAPEFIVLSNDRRSAVRTDARPTKCNLADYLVFPTSLAWTMAFTHESGWLGPYFAKHPNYDALIRQDHERCHAVQRREQEIQRAKREGWI